MEIKYLKHSKELVYTGKMTKQKNSKNDKIERNNLFSKVLTKKINQKRRILKKFDE